MPTSSGGGDGGAVDISPAGVACAAALLLVQVAISLRLGLGLHGPLIVAGLRCVLQLELLGLVLGPIFSAHSLPLVLAYAGFMVVVSAVEATGRPRATYRGMLLATLLIVGACAAATMALALTAVIRVTPWWAPQYLIPISGMVLGNTISGISIGLASVIEELSAGADQIERLLALGADRGEATADLVSRCSKLAMTPLLNQLSVVGLVSIPGMMTGQILSGSSPSSAARYQIVIMFLLSGSSSVAAVLSVLCVVRTVLDSSHRLRPDRLLPRTGKGGGVNGAINAVAAAVGGALARCLCCCSAGRQQGGTGSEPGGVKQPLLAAADGEEDGQEEEAGRSQQQQQQQQ